MRTITAGKPFPGPVPQQDGATLEMGPDGDLILLIQMRNQDPKETAALVEGFTRYSFYEHSGIPVLAVWIWKFPAPVGYMDSPFHAGLYKDGRVQTYLNHPEWNMLQVFALDGEIVKLIRLSGLQPIATALFRDTIRRQLAEPIPISPTGYNAAIDILYGISPEEIFRRGRQFKHGEKQ